MNYLQKRIKAVEREIKARNGGTFIVHYKDGTARRISPGDSINLCRDERDIIKCFEEEPGGNNGILKEIVNALLFNEGKDGT